MKQLEDTRTIELPELAARLADRELAALPGKPLTQITIDELAYAGRLFFRAEKALSTELAVLRAVGVQFDAARVLSLAIDLSQMGAKLSLLALQAQEARAA